MGSIFAVSLRLRKNLVKQNYVIVVLVRFKATEL